MKRFYLFLLILAIFLGFGCKKIKTLEKTLLSPGQERPAVKPVESIDLAQAILWPRAYNFSLTRDPFQPLTEKLSLVSPDKAEAQQESDIKVIGTLIKKEGSIALLELPAGMCIFREGDRIGRYRLKKIEPKRLILEQEKENKSLILELGERK